MKLRFIFEKEKEIYNAFVQQASGGHFLQSYEWGEIKTDWEAVRLIVEEDKKIKAAFLLLKRKIPLINRFIYYSPRGPVLDYNDTSVFDFLIAEVKKMALQEKVVFWKIDPDMTIDSIAFVQYLRQKGFKKVNVGEDFTGVQPRFDFRLSLANNSKEDILQNMHKKTRYNIRLASKKGVSIKIATSKKELKDFYNILLVTAKRNKFMVRSYKYFSDIWDIFVKEGYAKLFLAYYQDKLIAGAMSFMFAQKAWYIYGASSNEYRNLMPNYALQWEMIQWASEEKCRFYDFGGVSGDLNPDNPLYGLYKFKKGFNPDFIEFTGEYDLVFNQVYYFLWTKGLPLFKIARSNMLKAKRIVGKI